MYSIGSRTSRSKVLFQFIYGGVFAALLINRDAIHKSTKRVYFPLLFIVSSVCEQVALARFQTR